MVVNKLGCVILFTLIALSLAGQSSQKISISFSNETMQEALSKLDQVSPVRLSFNPQILPNDVHISKSFESASPEMILKEILGNRFQTKNIGDYIIIQKAVAPNAEKVSFQIKGGIKDANTGKELQDVSVYEINSLQSTLSNSKGDFDLMAKTNLEMAAFAISKKDYKDTIIIFQRNDLLEVPILMEKEVKATANQSVRERIKLFPNGLSKFFTSNKVEKNAQNVNMVDSRPFQFSLIPGVGTNRKLSSQMDNKVSINLIAGYSYGVSALELGGFYNIDREHVKGVQLGGFGNSVGGEVRGAQIGGVVNTTRDYVSGVQMAGVLNIASDSVLGFQAGGLTNLTKQMKGWQIAGLNNHTKSMSGVQASGFINTTGYLNGLQLAGAINTADQMNGWQVSGVMNKANVVKGIQLSVINLADSVISGAQVGLINIVKKNGFISPALESDDVVPYQFSFRSGIDHFYTVLSAGINPDNYWTLGMGFGSRQFLSEKRRLFLNQEIKWVTLTDGSPKENENYYLLRLNFNVGYQLFKHLMITGGPSLNVYSTNMLTTEGNPQLDIAGSPFMDRTTINNRTQMWVGYTLGIGF